MIVADSNVLAARNMEHEKSSFAEQVVRLDPVWIAPPLWRYEFQNILLISFKLPRRIPDDITL